MNEDSDVDEMCVLRKVGLPDLQEAIREYKLLCSFDKPRVTAMREATVKGILKRYMIESEEWLQAKIAELDLLDDGEEYVDDRRAVMEFVPHHWTRDPTWFQSVECGASNPGWQPYMGPLERVHHTDPDFDRIVFRVFDEELDKLKAEGCNERSRVRTCPRLIAAVVLEARAKFGRTANDPANTKVVGHHMRKLLKKSDCRMEIIDRHVALAVKIYFEPTVYDNVYKHATDTRILQRARKRELYGRLHPMRRWLLGARNVGGCDASE
jgi:hypothetical protein